MQSKVILFLLAPVLYVKIAKNNTYFLNYFFYLIVFYSVIDFFVIASIYNLS